MKHARQDYSRIQDPFNKIPKDEPVFLLRAQDILAPSVVQYWVDQAKLTGVDIDLLEKAEQHIQEMKEWQERNGCKIPDLPTKKPYSFEEKASFLIHTQKTPSKYWRFLLSKLKHPVLKVEAETIDGNHVRPEYTLKFSQSEHDIVVIEFKIEVIGKVFTYLGDS